MELRVGQENSREAVIGRRRAEQAGPRAWAGVGHRRASIRGAWCGRALGQRSWTSAGPW
jgi:hypothetical protein